LILEEGQSMERTRYTEEQIAFAVRQAESGAPMAEVIRKMGITEPTFDRWKKQFAGMGVTEIRRLPGVIVLVLATVRFSRSSPTMEKWRKTHPRFGKLIVIWQSSGTIPRSVKWNVVFSTVASYSLIFLEMGRVCYRVCRPQSCSPYSSMFGTGQSSRRHLFRCHYREMTVAPMQNRRLLMRENLQDELAVRAPGFEGLRHRLKKLPVVGRILPAFGRPPNVGDLPGTALDPLEMA
jgi:uncharacterized membrane protein YbaN (DUF454 family)